MPRGSWVAIKASPGFILFSLRLHNASKVREREGKVKIEGEKGGREGER